MDDASRDGREPPDAHIGDGLQDAEHHHGEGRTHAVEQDAREGTRVVLGTVDESVFAPAERKADEAGNKDAQVDKPHPRPSVRLQSRHRGEGQCHAELEELLEDGSTQGDRRDQGRWPQAPQLPKQDACGTVARQHEAESHGPCGRASQERLIGRWRRRAKEGVVRDDREARDRPLAPEWIGRRGRQCSSRKARRHPGPGRRLRRRAP